MREDTRSRGVLDESAARGLFTSHRLIPQGALARHVAYYWFVRWDLERPFEQHALTLPAAHFVFEKNDVTGERMSRVSGPRRTRFTRRLEGRGHIVGVALHAGLAAPWLGAPVHRYLERLVPLSDALSLDTRRVEREVLEAANDEAAVAAVERFLNRRAPVLDRDSLLAARLVEEISLNRTLSSVEALVRYSGRSERSLQRLFSRCVGVSPKAVMRRFRLVEAAEVLAQPRAPSMGRIAAELGYFDQAHFVRDFKRVVGRAPSSYRRDNTRQR